MHDGNDGGSQPPDVSLPNESKELTW